MDDSEISRVLLNQAEIDVIVNRLACEINEDYQALDSELLVLGLLKGSFIFMADLVRQINVPMILDFIAVSSYGNSMDSSADVQFLMDVQSCIVGRHLLIVEDIIDTGQTLEKIVGHLYKSKPNSVKICTLLDKPARRQATVCVDYIGKKIPDEFVCGYGLDYAQKYRNLPYIGVLEV